MTGTAANRTLAPATRAKWLTAQPFAHRGLHGLGVPENSRAAARAAVEQGFGIELDTILTQDREAMVFHDDLLDRLTHATGPAEALTAAQLAALPLRDGEENIPSLRDILDVVQGRVPLLIEVKAPRDSATPVAHRCQPVRRALEGYTGPFAVMSFHPDVGHWFRLHAPDIIRGLVITEQKEKNWWQRLQGRIFRRFAIRHARPDFLALNIRDLPSGTSKRMRAKGMPILTWTVKTPADEHIAIDHADEMIFERPGPDAPKGLLE